MKRTLLKSVAFICALFTAFSCFFSCTSKDEETEAPNDNTIIVKFNSNGGTPVDDMEFGSPQLIPEPDAPTRENYIFLYWENLSNNVQWIFSVNEVKEDMTLNAVWVSAESLFKTETTEDPNEIVISDFTNQRNISILTVPKTIYGKTVVGFTEKAFEGIHESYAKKVIIPDTVRFVGDESFKDITSVHVEFTAPLSGIGVSSFENCTHLESLKLASGITSIPYRCFFGASELSTLDIPEGVTVIEENAFSNCAAMQTIVLPASLTKIEDGAFLDSSALKVVFFKGTEEQFDKLDIADHNDELLDAKTYFYSETEPASEGKFWHYDKSGTPVLW